MSFASAFLVAFILTINVAPALSKVLSFDHHTSSSRFAKNSTYKSPALHYGSRHLYGDRPRKYFLDLNAIENEESIVKRIENSNLDIQNLIQKGRQQYEIGHFEEAIILWHQAIQSSEAQENRRYQPVLLTHISLAYQELGEWENAQVAIASSIDLLQNEQNEYAQQKYLLAQALTARGRLELSIGRLEDALATWQISTRLYQELKDEVGFTGSLINQALALEALGYYRRACTILLTAATVEKSCDEISLRNISPLLEEFEASSQNNPRIRILGLRSLGNVLRLMGYLTESQQVLERALNLTSEVDQIQIENDTLLSLANTKYALYQQAKELYEQTKPNSGSDQVLTAAQQALDEYQAVIERSETVPISQITHIQAQLQKLALLIDFWHWAGSNSRRVEQSVLPLAIEAQVQALLSANLERLPPSRTTIYIYLNFAKSLVQANTEWASASTRFAQLAFQRARALQDERAQSYALGTLGELYEQIGTTQPEILLEAQEVTEQALGIAQAIQTWELAYQWQWQLGRLYAQQGQRNRAIPYYQAAVETLEGVRKNLVAAETDLQFSFRDDVEPVYRELVTLLLEESNSSGPSQPELQQAVRTIDTLQVSELENFLRCDLTSSISIDEAQVDPGAAVLYTMILNNQLSVVVKLPQSEQLYLHSVLVSREEVDEKLSALKSELTRPYISPRSLSLSQEIYDWLIRPAESELAASNIQTLVFVLDGRLRSIPMAALHNGQRYLIEDYAIALEAVSKLTCV